MEIPEIVARDLSNDGLKGNELTVELIKVIQEMQMPNTMVDRLGDTVFITHYTEDRKYGAVRVLSADSTKAVANNFEKYVRVQMGRDLKAVAMTYSKPKDVQPVFAHLEKLRMVEIHTAEGDDGQYVSMIMLGTPTQKEP